MLAELMESKDKVKLDALGGVIGLAKSLGSDLEGGLIASSEQDLEIRRKQYGVNKVERKPSPTIFALFLDAMRDTTIIILLFAAGESQIDANLYSLE